MNLISEVIFVFDSEHLKKRDQVEFKLLFTAFTGSVQYVVGLDALKAATSRKKNRIVVFDEADALIFHDVVKFEQVVNSAKCVCFTATPNNQVVLGVESKILDLLGLV